MREPLSGEPVHDSCRDATNSHCTGANSELRCTGGRGQIVPPGAPAGAIVLARAIPGSRADVRTMACRCGLSCKETPAGHVQAFAQISKADFASRVEDLSRQAHLLAHFVDEC